MDSYGGRRSQNPHSIADLNDRDVGGRKAPVEGAVSVAWPRFIGNQGRRRPFRAVFGHQYLPCRDWLWPVFALRSTEAHGAFAGKVADGLKLRHDHGSQYMSDIFQEETRFWGVEISPAFVREPEGNGCVERSIRVLKENLLWIQSFETIEELRQALHEFKDRYNESSLIERCRYKPPAQIRKEQLQPIFAVD